MAAARLGSSTRLKVVAPSLAVAFAVATAVIVIASRLHGMALPSPTTGPIAFEAVDGADLRKFRLENSPSPQKHLPETMAGGVAAFDFDGDGRVDIFVANGATMPDLEKSGPRYWNRLYRNMGGMRFADVTAAAGVQGYGYSIGAAVGDFDNDGHPDLFVAGVGRNTLYRNRGDGRFTDVTREAGIARDEWSEGAVWLDYDRDGLLDLFVTNYLKWTPKFDLFCGDPSRNIRVYCHPRVFEGTTNRLYRNLGGGRFRDVSAESGIAKYIGKGMAASVADYDGDGYPDIFVTNDKVPNFLFHNLRNGRFEEVALDVGTALADTGAEMSAMGSDFRDVDNDGRPDIGLTALSGETFLLFRNGGGSFTDSTYKSRLGPLSRIYSGWGMGFIDFDNDGAKDLFTANSHVNDRVEAFEATEYRQHNTVFRNDGTGRFQDVTASAGAEFAASARAHRGCAFADFDGDGRIDVVTSSLGDAPELWRNTSASGNTWLIVKLRGTVSNREGIGAVVRIGSQTNHMSTSVGYASSSDFGVHFGTGRLSELEKIEIAWPSGIRQEIHNVRTNQVLQIEEPAHRAAPADERRRR